MDTLAWTNASPAKACNSHHALLRVHVTAETPDEVTPGGEHEDLRLDEDERAAALSRRRDLGLGTCAFAETEAGEGPPEAGAAWFDLHHVSMHRVKKAARMTPC